MHFSEGRKYYEETCVLITTKSESNDFILIRQCDVHFLERGTINTYALSILAQTDKNFPEDRNSPPYLASERSYC